MSKTLSHQQLIEATWINVAKVHAMCELVIEQNAEILAKLNSTTREAELSKSMESLKAKYEDNANKVKDALEL